MSAPRAGARRPDAAATPGDAGSGAGAPTGARWFLLPSLAALALVAGYADLVRGGITLGPILLVLAYCVLIPAAILKR